LDLVLVCHSLGLHFLSPALLARAGLVVIISGFAHFHGQRPEDGRFTRRHLARMRSRLHSDPAGLIRDFHRDCDCPAWPADPRAMDRELLDQDLTLLDQGRWPGEACRQLPPALLLHGREDRIVRPERATELAAMLPGSRVVIIDQAGHGLPFTHPGLCLEHIRAAYATITTPSHDQP
jgi:pimeloyl-ACP methyl ester carboxylesterase